MTDAPPIVATILPPRKPGGRGNLGIENTKFFGRPNFSGEMNQFKDSRRQLTVQIPNKDADELRKLGWNVKTKLADEDRDGDEDISFLKVMLDYRDDPENPGSVAHERGPLVVVIQGDQREHLTSATVGLLDRANILQLDLEVRGWEYNPAEEPGKLSARLVALVAVIQPNFLAQKYKGLI